MATASLGDQELPRSGSGVCPHAKRGRREIPSLSTSGETLTIEELMTLRARTENAGDVGVEHEWSWGSG